MPYTPPPAGYHAANIVQDLTDSPAIQSRVREALTVKALSRLVSSDPAPLEDEEGYCRAIIGGTVDLRGAAYAMIAPDGDLKAAAVADGDTGGWPSVTAERLGQSLTDAIWAALVDTHAAISGG